MPRALLLLAAAALATPALAGCLGGGSQDSDGDGVPDVVETTPHAINVKTAEGERTYDVTSDPNVADTDGDGLSDLDELRMGTDPRKVDTDGDGLADGHNIRANPGTALYDALVTARVLRAPGDPTLFLGELDACGGGEGSSPTNWDSDRPIGDKLGDGAELMGWNVTVHGRTYHVSSSPCAPDTDSDGLLDGEEKAKGTDPNVKDTDGDGAIDSIDADPLFDLGLDLALGTLTLHAPKPLGDDVRVIVSSSGTQRDYTAHVGSTADLGAKFAANPEDGTADPKHLTTSIFIVATTEVAGNRQPLRINGGSNSVEMTYDLITQEWSIKDGGRGRQSGTTDGTDASLGFALATTRS